MGTQQKSSLREWAEQNGFFDDNEYHCKYSKYHLSSEKHRKDQIAAIILRSYVSGGPTGAAGSISSRDSMLNQR